MNPKSETGGMRRRRGRELEAALLEAAWQELLAGGYGAFTIEAVADRAGTSRPVLYRRWPNRKELALAAVRRRADQSDASVPDTGSLRGDVKAVLTRANEDSPELAAVISLHLGAYFQETGTTLADLRLDLMGERVAVMDTIIDRAVERGEIDRARVTPRVTALPLDLLRHDVLMTLAPVPQTAIDEIVDDVFLPLVRGFVDTRSSDRSRSS